jgi:hypothetical protein
MTNIAAGAIGRRIAVWGATGSGKTTLARWLGQTLDLGVIELDAIRHARGWDSTPWDEFREQVAQALAANPQGWVTDGSYSRISDVYLSQIDTLIWIGVPWRLSFWRLLRRTLGRAWTREPLYNPQGPRESWRMTFFSPKSILWWSISHHRATRRNLRLRLAALPSSIAFFDLATPAAVRAFQLGVVAQAAAAPPTRGD